MKWQIKRFDELTTTELYQILRLRTAVFVVNQQRIYQEVDNRDLKAIHVFALAGNNEIVAYARVFLTDNGQKVTFGRVVTSEQVRGQGVGGQLLTKIMQTIRHSFPGKPIEIESQAQVQGFYERAGFVAQGEPFIYESTPHVKMMHQPL